MNNQQSIISRMPADALEQVLQFVGSKTYLPLILRCVWSEYQIYKKNNSYQIRQYRLNWQEGEITSKIPYNEKPMNMDDENDLINFLMGEIETEHITDLDEDDVEIDFKFIFGEVYRKTKFYCYTEDKKEARKQLNDIKKKLKHCVNQIGKIYTSD